MLSWVESLSICSMTYTASAVPAPCRDRADFRQVIENQLKIAGNSDRFERFRGLRWCGD
jgi:hypothetical protein